MTSHTHEAGSTKISHSHSSTEALALITRRRLMIVLFMTTVFMFVEFIVGMLSNSLALLADAGHMLNDVFSISLALLALKISNIKSSKHNSFGFKRVEVLSGLANGISLIVIGVLITREAIHRFQTLSELEIVGPLMLITAFIGMIVNLLGMKMLKPAKEDSINVEGAYEHIVADLLGSIGAIIAAIGIILWEFTWADLVASVIVSIMVIKSGSAITVRAVKILLETSPEGVDLDLVMNKFREIPGVVDIHDFHAWRITNNWDVIMTHVTIEEGTDQSEILSTLKIVAEEHGFNHPTFQIEFLSCNGSIECVCE